MTAVPTIEKQAGIECYCTKFPGVGGRIKQNHGGFRVSELVSDSFAGGVSRQFDDLHRYPLYLLEKEGIDSNHALFEIERAQHMRLRVMGIKDSKAVTVQYAGSERQMKDAPQELRTAHCRIKLEGFTRRPLDKRFLAGNKFEIRIDGPVSSDLDEFIPEIESIGNFYGLQRFGSERLVTHLVGREIVKRNFGGAVELLLTYTTEHDSEMSRELRHEMSDPSKYSRLARTLPGGMDIERQVLSVLAQGKDPISALRAVPLVIRRLFVQAYQSFIFNRCLSRSISEGESLTAAREGDLCFEMEDESTFGRIAKFENSKAAPVVPAIRLAGYTFQPGRGRFEQLTQKVLDDEGTVPKDFYIKEMQELSQQGGFRQAPLWCRGFRYTKSPDLEVSFRLPKGSYATALLREVMKARDPIGSGF